MTPGTEDICKKAIDHVLVRISQDEDIRFRLGAGTEAYHLLTAAAAQLWDVPVEQVREKFIPGSAVLHKGEVT